MTHALAQFAILPVFIGGDTPAVSLNTSQHFPGVGNADTRKFEQQSNRELFLPKRIGRWIQPLLRKLAWLVVLPLTVIGNPLFVFGQNPQSQQETFFENKIRPLLVKHCVECHGRDDQSGDLRLDRKRYFEQGGAAGPVVAPGNPDASRLNQAIGYQNNDLQMPPAGKLSQTDIGLFNQWVKDGAFWPNDKKPLDVDPDEMSVEEFIATQQRSHWSLQPIIAPAVPANIHLPAGWADSNDLNSNHEPTDIDRFVLAKLAEANLPPNRKADRRALIYRAYFTLLGLPPSFEEVQAFLADEKPDAFASLVDHLLDSPHYGERWARHWLDIARYGDTKGYFAGNRETRFPFAFTYRDYVIDAFNRDKPFDQFILEQLAADQLDLKGPQRKNLAAMGLLTVGRRFMNRQPDIIDDQIDVVTRGFLGLTVSCARCHDHKYDPVPTADYYSLYGVFASSQEPSELPLLGEPKSSPDYEAFLAAKAVKQREVDEWVEQRRVETEVELRSRVADYLALLPGALENFQRGKLKLRGERGPLRRGTALRWHQYLSNPTESSHPIWALWRLLAATPADEFATQTPLILQEIENSASDNVRSKPSPLGNEKIPQRLLNALIDAKPQTMNEAAKAIGTQLEAVNAEWEHAKKDNSTLERLIDDDAEWLRQVLWTPGSPTSLSRDMMIAYLNQSERNQYNQLVNKVNGVEVTHPGAPPRAMVMVDKPNPIEPVIFRRGVASNRGDPVPRRFLQVLAHVDGGQPFKHGSGRLELARAIASPNNPLTARVLVNRIWQHHFGEGLVRTPSNFGSRGERPSHPKLLDYLAAEFIADGWSIKRLQRKIMLSAVWQQTSELRAEPMKIDPENRLLWRMPRQRLEFEPLRDRLLVAAGRLDDRVGGRSVMIHQDATRRGLYAYIDREDLPGLLASFDLPSPDASQAQRTKTTVPQQALYLMNSAFAIQQAKALADRTKSPSAKAETNGGESADSTNVSLSNVAAERIRQMYRFALSREPNQQELLAAIEFVDPTAVEIFRREQGEDPAEQPRWRFGYGFWDQKTHQVRFTALPYFSGRSWQASKQFPDPELGYLQLSAGGGHPGSNDQINTIRRWISPISGSVSIKGRIKHPTEKGDGVSATIIHSRSGILGEWTAFNTEVETTATRLKIKVGDTIDFVVGCISGPSFDSYSWAPTIELLESLESDQSLVHWPAGHVWNASTDYAESSRRITTSSNREELDPWCQLAQVLLLSNEFAFVD